MHVNYEFKAKTSNLETLEARLKELSPLFIGIDHQVDRYFNVDKGRLKLREGNIENALIYYERNDLSAARHSNVTLYQHDANPALRIILTKALGEKVVIDKKRKIYFIENVKFHFDEVEELGCFVEVEAIDIDGSIGIEKLKEQCNAYAKLFQLTDADYIAASYSDLLLAKKSSMSTGI